MDQEPDIKDKIYTVYEVWQSQDLMKHKRLTLKMVRVIKDAFDYYTLDEICDAIRNYGKIFNDHASWFKMRYSLDAFISEKMDRFLSENDPMQTHYRGTSGSGIGVAGDHPPPGSPAILPDSLNNFNERFKQWKKDKHQ